MVRRRLIRRAARAVLCVLAVAAAGCASKFEAGARLPVSPPGWVDFCKRQPADCPPLKKEKTHG